ncbi:unnamed protein product, partial [Prorocentrum cordatum]
AVSASQGPRRRAAPAAHCELHTASVEPGSATRGGAKGQEVTPGKAGPGGPGMLALGDGAHLRLRALEGGGRGGGGLAHGPSWSEGSAGTRSPSESSFDAASEDDDRPRPTGEVPREPRGPGWCGSPPQAPQPWALRRSDTAELTQEVPALLDRMNEASSRVNRLEREAGASEARYKRRVVRYEEIYRGMRAEFGGVFDRCKPLCAAPLGHQALRAQLGDSTVEELVRCYQTLDRHHDALAQEHKLMERLSQKLRDAKRVYASTMCELEGISNMVHEVRQKR